LPDRPLTPSERRRLAIEEGINELDVDIFGARSPQEKPEYLGLDIDGKQRQPTVSNTGYASEELLMPLSSIVMHYVPQPPRKHPPGATQSSPFQRGY
jgi:hypothetical protein